MSRVISPELSALWEEHCIAPFPEELRGAEVCDERVEWLDVCIAGPVCTFVGGGHPTPWQIEALTASATLLRELLPELPDGGGRKYVTDLIRMAELIPGDLKTLRS